MSEDATTGYFFRLRAQGLSRSDEDAFTSSCFDLGAEGVAEDLKFTQKDLRYDPDVVPTEKFDVNVYFSQALSEDSLLRLQSEYSEVRIEIVREENKDWLAEWKKGFVPFRFSEPFWVIPSWCKPPPEASANPNHHIYIEPGMAFGTGTHETTRLAAGLLVEYLKAHPSTSLLDVGTGTGILALIALRLGVSQVIGLDNDPEARRTGRENLERNHASEIAIPDDQLQDVVETFDVVVANIIDGVLTSLRHDLRRRLKPGGRMILSGVLTDREDDFYSGFTRDTGLSVIKKVTEGEWSAALLMPVADPGAAQTEMK